MEVVDFWRAYKTKHSQKSSKRQCTELLTRFHGIVPNGTAWQHGKRNQLKVLILMIRKQQIDNWTTQPPSTHSSTRPPMATKQATLDDATVALLQPAIRELKNSYAQAVKAAGVDAYGTFQKVIAKLDERFLPYDQAFNIFAEALGGQDVLEKVYTLLGFPGNRKFDGVPQEYTEEGKGIDTRKNTLSFVLLLPLSMDKKMDFAFTLADADGNGYIDKECVDVVDDVDCD